MSVSYCPSCGAEYIEGIEVCADCDVPLVGEPVSEEEEEDQLAYELDEYDRDARALVEQLLTGEAIPHAWEGATLVVRASDEAAVDHILEQVDAGSGLDADAEQVVYELGDWSEEHRHRLVEALVAAGIAYEWDENGDLAVLEDDEERVEAMLDAIEYPDALPVDDGSGDGDDGAEDGEDGLLAQDTLSELFVAADRLMHDAEDHEGVLSLVDASRLADTLPLPFGFNPPVWAGIVEQAAALRQLLESDTAEDDEVMAQARMLRNLLRDYV